MKTMKIRRYLVALMGGAVALAIGASGALAGGGSDTTGYQPASNGFNPARWQHQRNTDQ